MILVTGGLGFLGSHIALSLMAQGKEVVIVDNLSNSNLQILKRLEFISQRYVPFFKVDVRNTPALTKVFEQFSIHTVVHAAGFKSVEESVLKPLEYYNSNVSCIMSLLRSMQQTGIRSLIHLSSLQIYGTSSLDLTEETPIQYGYDNPYIKSQQMIENIIQDTFRTDTEWKIAILRLGNVAGAFEHAVLGEIVTPLPKSIVPLMMQVATGVREFIELRKQQDNQTVQRSFIHVLDICLAIQLTLNWLNEQQNVLESFNIGGTTISISELIKIIGNVTHKQITTVDAQHHFIKELGQIGTQSRKAQEVLGWNPQKTIQQMIEDQWRFYNQTLKGQ